MTHSHLAWEFAELFEGLDNTQINEMLANNVPMEMLRFFGEYGRDFAEVEGIEGSAEKRVPNLMILGYLLRVLEERLILNEAEPID